MKNCLPVEDKELLSRHIYFPLHINKKSGLPKWQAFKPTKDGETSVTRQDYTSAEEVFRLGRNRAKRNTFLVFQGKADIVAKDVRTKALDIEPAPNNDDHNHADIIRWPAEKEEQIDLCKQLLLKSTFTRDH